MIDEGDLIEIGMEADAVRQRWHPEGIVSYSTESPSNSQTVELIVSQGDLLNSVESVQHRAVRLKIPPADCTAVEALKLIALARIRFADVKDVEISASEVGLKFCQIALRFGVNDLGHITGSPSEEQIRRLIREAGFVPRKRGANYEVYEVS